MNRRNHMCDYAGRLTQALHDFRGADGSLTNKAWFDYGYNAVNSRKWVKRETGKGDVYAYDATQPLKAVWYDASNVDTTATSPAGTEPV